MRETFGKFPLFLLGKGWYNVRQFDGETSGPAAVRRASFANQAFWLKAGIKTDKRREENDSSTGSQPAIWGQGAF